MNTIAIDRRGYIGGSDIGSLFGVNHWKSAYELWEEKTADAPVEEEFSPEREKILRRGRRLEPWIIELLEEERGIFVQRRNVYHSDEEFPWMRCQLDFEYMEEFGLCNGEAKTVSPFAAQDWGEPETDQIPLSYCLQTMWGLGITKRSRTLVAALIGADDLRVHFVDRDEDLIQEIRRRAYHFWTENVLKRIPPEPVTKLDIQKALYKRQGFISPGSPEVWKAVRKLNGAKAAIKRLNDVKDEQEMTIKKALLAEAEAMGLCDGNSPRKFIVNDISGKPCCTVALQHRKAYSVGETDFLMIRT